MDADYFRTLFDYSYWARDRILDALAGMSEDDYARPNGFNYGSIRGILTHCLDAEWSWRCRFDGDTFTGRITQEQVPTPEALAERWRLEEAKMRAYLEKLTDDQVRADLVMRRRSGEEVRNPLWWALAHVVNHGTQHRSEAAEALTMVGRSPGELDLFLFLRDRSG